MRSLVPVSLNKPGPSNLDAEILRAAVVAELEAIQLYERMAILAGSKRIKKLLLHIAHEEKSHVSAFMAILLGRDPDRIEESAEGKKETRLLPESVDNESTLALASAGKFWISNQGEKQWLSQENTGN